MEHPTRNQRLQALKAENVPIPDNRHLFGDGHLDKIMDSYLYEATKNGDADEFITALEKASCGSEDVVELILIHFPYLVSRKNFLDDTPLHVAVQDGSIVKSPLYLAAENGQHGIFWLLLHAAAQDEAYAVKIQGTSPVFATLKHFRSGNRFSYVYVAINLLPKLLHVRDENGGTPLHSAASIGDVNAVQLLLEKCSYLALQTDENGSYPIHIAFEGGNLDTIKELVKIWPDLAEIKNKKGQNVLHVAAKAGNNNAVQYILKECGGPCIKKLVACKDVNGNTPLHLASMQDHCRVLLSLTRDNRDALRLLNNDKLTALDVAMESESMSAKYSPLQGRAILIAAGIPQTKGRDIWSPREQSSGVSKSPRTKGISDQIITSHQRDQ
ncbi:hypothetical protein ACJRO7_006778 [Eucalyptus globulus]|uniref:Uncharacterized protein n=1 Tax=Eucalyptus globulus TaxID=34317 RepID=A0ABD3IMM4_EUCGL